MRINGPGTVPLMPVAIACWFAIDTGVLPIVKSNWFAEAPKADSRPLPNAHCGNGNNVASPAWQAEVINFLLETREYVFTSNALLDDGEAFRGRLAIYRD